MLKKGRAAAVQGKKILVLGHLPKIHEQLPNYVHTIKLVEHGTPQTHD
jgi:hypothetical protein